MRERILFIELVLAVSAVHLALATIGYKRTRGLLERISARSPRRPASSKDLIDAHRLAVLAGAAGSNGLFKATCLRQSLVTYALLRRRGLDPEFMLGVRKQEGTLDAHAWVELGGEQIGPSSTHERFKSASG